MKVINSRIVFGGGSQIPNRVVVHAMGEYLESLHAVDFLKKYKYSAHALIAPNGDVYRCRLDDEMGWHAKGFNKNSLGIEFLVDLKPVKGEHIYRTFLNTIRKPYVTNEQLESGLNEVNGWIDNHLILNIDRHCDLSPGRKIDPGEGFPWYDFLGELNHDFK